MKIELLEVFWEDGKTSEYEDIKSVDADTTLGLPRMSITFNDNNIFNINLDKVLGWKVYRAAQESTDEV